MIKAQSDSVALPTSVLRGIGDKLYERRKQGNLSIHLTHPHPV